MSGQMCWLSQQEELGEKVLYVRTQPHHPWQPYTAHPQLAVPDYNIPNGSKGWATYQKLMRDGWTLVPNVKVSEPAVLVSIQWKGLAS